MKTKMLKRIETASSAIRLTLLFACSLAKPSSAETQDPAPAAPPAAGMVRYEASPTGSKMTIEGTANIHDWTMESVLLGGYLETDARFPESALSDATAAKPVVSVYMP